LQELFKKVGNTGGALHAPSRRLHPAIPEIVGLTPRVSEFCKEFSAQQGIKIDFTRDPIPGKVNPDVVLCVFRQCIECPSLSASCRQQNSFLVSDHGSSFNPKGPEIEKGWASET
jgi:hypothetical protein